MNQIAQGAPTVYDAGPRPAVAAIATARKVIRKCGGHAVVAEILGIDVSRVYRFTYSKERGGTGGLIPTRHQHRLMAAARECGFTLSPDDFFLDIVRPKRDWLFVASRPRTLKPR